jgi:hypothetical protein
LQVSTDVGTCHQWIAIRADTKTYKKEAFHSFGIVTARCKYSKLADLICMGDLLLDTSMVPNWDYTNSKCIAIVI